MAEGRKEKRLGSLSLIEVDDATELAGALFKQAFRAEIPRFPRHFVLLRKTLQGDIPIGYVHYTKSANAYLGGGLAVSAMEFRKLEKHTAELVRREGGFAEWAVRTSCECLDDADAVFAYMGDAKSIRVNTRVGFSFTGRRHLYALWKRQLPPDEQEALIERIAAIGPF
jgi:hypothetical protein